MAQKIADWRYLKCTKEAEKIVYGWYERNQIKVSPKSVHIVWFAFTKHGYRCMVSCKDYPNDFFEIKKNVFSEEMICHVLKQVECVIEPSRTSPIVMHDRVDDHVDIPDVSRELNDEFAINTFPYIG